MARGRSSRASSRSAARGGASIPSNETQRAPPSVGTSPHTAVRRSSPPAGASTPTSDPSDRASSHRRGRPLRRVTRTTTEGGDGPSTNHPGGADVSPRPHERNVLVTVGTTSFDALIAAMDRLSVVDALRAKGYTSMTMQIGRGAYKPRRVVPLGCKRFVHRRGAGGKGKRKRVPADGGAEGADDGGADREDFVVEVFEFRPSLDRAMRAASLVVSHAGAGSVFEALGLGRPLLVVVNETLMDNHQEELARELAGRRHLRWCAPDAVEEAIAAFDPTGLVPYAPGNPARLAAAFDQLLGRDD